MTTKHERSDILLDAVGYIGEDLVAEASGVSNVIQIPSKLKLNLMVMRRIVAAMICFVLISALTPLSVYLYNNYVGPASRPDTSEGSTQHIENDDTNNGDNESLLFSVPDYYEIDAYSSLELVARENNAMKKVTAHVLALTHLEDSSRATYIEIRDYDNDSMTDSVIVPGFGIVILKPTSPSTLIVLNTELAGKESTEGYVQISEYYVNDAKLTDIPISGTSRAEFSIASDYEFDNSRQGVFNLFIQLTEEIGEPGNSYLILDTYSSSSDIACSLEDKVPAPDIYEDRKSGKNTWSLDHIGSLWGYTPEEITQPPQNTEYVTENGLTLVNFSSNSDFLVLTATSDEKTSILEIPQFYAGLPVTIIGDHALDNCRAETIIIPEWIKTVQKQTLNADVKTLIIESNDNDVLSTSGFARSEIREVIFTGNLTHINSRIFAYCKNLESVTLPETLTLIMESAFISCSSLKTVNYPSSLKSIQENAFLSCTSLKEILLPEGFNSLGESAFHGCFAVEKINVPSTLEKLPQGSFSGHNCLSITIPEGVSYIGQSAIRGGRLEEIYLPSTLTYFHQNDLYSSNSDIIEKIHYNGTIEEYRRNVGLWSEDNLHENGYIVYCSDGIIEMYKKD